MEHDAVYNFAMYKLKGSIALRYIFFELLPSFLVSNIIFVFIILMFQGLRFTEFALVNNVSFMVLGKMMGYMTIGFLPVLFPMSLLLSVLLTYSRLSADSEIVALKSCGMSIISIMAPAIILGILTALLSTQMAFNLGPWGNRQFEMMVSRMMSAKASIALKEGTFMDGFFNLVVYAAEVDQEKGKMKDVFIFDDRTSPPLTVIAKEGLIKQQNTDEGLLVNLRLKNGNIHQKSEGHTKIDFGIYDIKLKEKFRFKNSEKTLQSYTLNELKQKKGDTSISDKDRLALQSEYYKRWSVSLLCIVFSMVGVGLGTFTNRRSHKGGGIALAIVIIVGYWILFVTFESLSRKGQIPAQIAAWIPNFIFFIFGLHRIQKNWN